jgi:glutamate N-acetyltransferase/amino-acid N-acetyltransferase
MLARDSTARAVCINAGIANACTGPEGEEDCRESLRIVGKAMGLEPGDVLPASTGVIGPRFDLEAWRKAAPMLHARLGQDGPDEFARAIMTTDAFPKLAQAEAQGARILGMAKGAGMICPNMATMLAVVLTDARLEPKLWQAILNRAVAGSFNCASVDGDTSTNDTVFALANGAAGVAIEDEDGPFADAVLDVCRRLAYMLVEDGEGATRVLRIRVRGAENLDHAELAARAVGHSPLVKTAFYGKDGNWGRIVAALGRSGAAFAPEAVRVDVAGVTLFEGGRPVPGHPAAELAPLLEEREIAVDISLGDGPGLYELLASDLSHEYVSINADYTT